MHESMIKEDLSLSYICAISSFAGILCNVHKHDSDGTDLVLSKDLKFKNNKQFNASIRVQLKATSSSSQYHMDEEFVFYRLKAKNFNDLCRPATTPMILALLILPEDKDRWIRWSIEELLIHATMYWKSFDGEKPSDNTGTVTVKINKQNVLNVQTIETLLENVAKEA